MVDISTYKVGVVLSIKEQAKKGGKALRTCEVDVGDEEPLVVVTSAPNVREGSRVVIAPVGTTVLNEEGEEMQVQKTSVGGVMSEGMFCDSRMLGWSGGAAGIAVQVPESVAGIGEAPPASKPRPNEGGESAADVAPAAPGLFEKKLTKEEKKKLAEEKRKARREAKAAKSKEQEE